MPRTKGAKNLPKSIGELITQLQEQAQKSGKKFSYSLSDLEGKPVPEAKEYLESQLESLKLDEDEGDTYTCGACQGTLDGKVETCPHCGAGLCWG